VAGAIRFERASLEAFRPEGEYGCMVCNPPYGERLGGDREVQNLYRAMGRLYRGLQTWSFFALSSHEGFQKHFGLRASRNRKLYNGSLRCYYYQYFGPLPPRA
jgi:putative N6-adenine-specific DNA methylase